ncbi:MAG: hypothetical protein QM803_05000 [Rhodocyclaceae bacterium]
MLTPPLNPHFVPRKTGLGAHVVAIHDGRLQTGLRQVLLLADGHRTYAALASMLPGRNVEAELVELAQRGLIDDAEEASVAGGHEQDISEQWMHASSFMMERAKETLGVAAVDIVEEIEHAQDPEAARQATTHWYRAMRESRLPRERADADRIEVARLMSERREG